MKAFIAISLRPQVVKTACQLSLIVGSILALINHGPAIMAMSLTTQNILQILLTYFVPYAVSTYSSVKAISAAES